VDDEIAFVEHADIEKLGAGARNPVALATVVPAPRVGPATRSPPAFWGPMQFLVSRNANDVELSISAS
jgi:hypothetical protein